MKSEHAKSISFWQRPHLLTLVATSIITLSISACSPATPTAETSTDTTTTAQTTPQEASQETPQTAVSEQPAMAEQIVYVEDGVAIQGADPVAYFTEAGFVEGSDEFTHEWQGVTWQFASAENRDLFAAEPEKYAPQYGGYCAWAVGQNALAAIDPNAWSIVEGKLYLNANKRIQDRWNKDIPGNIALAEANWPELSQQ